MNDVMFAFLLTLFAGLATGAGGLIVLFSNKTNLRFLSACLSFSAGVMIYVSFVEIFFKALESLEYELGEETGMLVGTLVFFGGIVFIALIDRFIPHYEEKEVLDNIDMRNFGKEGCLSPEEEKKLHRTGLSSAIAVALHNFPEGMVTFMAAMYDHALGIAIAVAIAIHNIPEGIAMASPIYYATGSKKKALLLATASGLTEPLGGLLGFWVLSQVFGELLLGVAFASAAGIMVFIAIHQLLPAAQKYGDQHIVMKNLFAGMAVMALSIVLLT